VPVGPWWRLLARIIDGLILFVINVVIVAIIGGGTGAFGETGVRAFAAGIVTTAVGYAYYVFLESSRGQTLGKMALSFQVVGPDGGLPSTEQAAKRNAWLLLSILPVLGGLAQLVIAIVIGVTINSDPFKRGWHDNLAGGTAVVRVS
jgi:uncharacterized RDD family membrane protein YckC